VRWRTDAHEGEPAVVIVVLDVDLTTALAPEKPALGHCRPGDQHQGYGGSGETQP
jgi:hypothetical protein